MMVCACFAYSETSEFALIEGNIDSFCYYAVLETMYLLLFERYHPHRRILQQDNAAARSFAYTKNFFFDIDVVVLL